MTQHALGPILFVIFISHVASTYMFTRAGFWFAEAYVGNSCSVAKRRWHPIFGMHFR